MVSLPCVHLCPYKHFLPALPRVWGPSAGGRAADAGGGFGKQQQEDMGLGERGTHWEQTRLIHLVCTEAAAGERRAALHSRYRTERLTQSVDEIQAKRRSERKCTSAIIKKRQKAHD